MATKVADGYVEITADVDKANRDVPGKFGKIGTAAAVGFGAAFAAVRAIGGAVRLFGDAIEEAEQADSAFKITQKVIKATGGVANVSSRDVDVLTASLEKQVAVDGDLIREGTNILLTFKNIRNEVGAGNQVFDRANAAMLDIAAVMGGDANGAAKQLGRALNDPIKGTTALARAGVQFTDQQKKQIETLVKSGDTLGAQKIILKEIEGQVGGTAAASADATDRISVAWGNAKEAIGKGFLPIVDELSVVLSEDLLPMLQEDIIPMVKNLADAFQEHAIPAIKDLIGFLGDLQQTASEEGEGTSEAVRKWLGVRVPETLDESGRGFDRYVEKIEDTKKDSVKSFQDLWDLINDKTITGGEKFGLIWTDIWDESEREQKRSFSKMLTTEDNFLDDINKAVQKAGKATNRHFRDQWRETGTIQKAGGRVMTTAMDTLTGGLFSRVVKWGRESNTAWRNIWERVNTGARVWGFVFQLTWFKLTRNVTDVVSSWGRNFVTWWRELPSRIIDGLGNVGKRIKDAFMKVLGGGLKIPLNLSFGGDGLGFGGIPGKPGGTLMGISPNSTIGRAYTAMGRPGDVISGFRNSRTRSGARSYHFGRALDIVPTTRAFVQAIIARFGSRTKELISPFADLGIHNGRPHRYSDAVQGDHDGRTNVRHIHWAMARGGTALQDMRALVGEHGPEILDLKRGDMVQPLSSTQRAGALGLTPGTPINLVVPELGVVLEAFVDNQLKTVARRDYVSLRKR